MATLNCPVCDEPYQPGDLLCLSCGANLARNGGGRRQGPGMEGQAPPMPQHGHGQPPQHGMPYQQGPPPPRYEQQQQQPPADPWGQPQQPQQPPRPPDHGQPPQPSYQQDPQPPSYQQEGPPQPSYQQE